MVEVEVGEGLGCDPNNVTPKHPRLCVSVNVETRWAIGVELNTLTPWSFPQSHH